MVVFVALLLFMVISRVTAPEIEVTPRPTFTPIPKPTAISSVPPADVFDLADQVESTNDWWKSDERIIKRCIAISGHEEEEFGDTYRSVAFSLQAMEDDLMDGRMDEFTVEQVKKMLALVSGVTAAIVMCAAEQ